MSESFDAYMKRHKKELMEYAKKNTKYDKDGHAVPEKDDEWRDEDIWDEHAKALS